MVTVNAFGKVERNAARVLDHGGAFKHNAGHVRLASHRRAAGHVPIVNTTGRVILPIAWHILMRARVVYPYAIRTGKKITDCLLSGVRASLECVLKRVIEPGPISDALRLIKSRADPRRDARVRIPAIGVICARFPQTVRAPRDACPPADRPPMLGASACPPREAAIAVILAI